MRKRITAVVMMVMLLLCSCGEKAVEESEEIQRGSGEETTAGQESGWMLQENVIPDADAAMAGLIPEAGYRPLELAINMVGDTLYRVVTLRGEGMTALGVCIQKLRAPYMEWENTPVLRDEWVDGEYCYAVSAAIRKTGSIDILLRGVDTDNNFHYYIAEWTESDGYTTKQISGEYFTDEFQASITNCYVDADNTTYFVTNAGVQYFDETFSEQKECSNTGDIWQIVENTAAEGEVYLCGSSIEGDFCIWTATGREPVFSSESVSMYDTDKVAFTGETEGFLCNTEGIWQFSMGDGQMENSLSFYEQGYTVERICGAASGENGALLILAAVDGKYVLLQKVEDKSWQDKTELEFATTYVSSFLQEAVVDFNKQSEEYYIVLRKPAEGENFSDFRARIQAEVSSGGGPALLDGGILNVAEAARKGLLRNLTEDFADQKNLMQENICAVGEVAGERYAIPYSFSVNTLVTSADVVGEKENWTPEEMMQCAKTSGKKAAIGCYEGAALFNGLTVYSGSGGKLVDWENGKSFLNSGAAVSILEFAKEYSDTEGWENLGVRIADGEVLTTQITFSNLSAAQIMEALFQGKETYIGFPTGEGESGNVLLGCTVSVNRSCKHPEGATAFIDYLLSGKMQDKLAEEACGSTQASGGFPVCSDAIEQMFVYAENVQGTAALFASYCGYEYVQEPLGQESLEKVRKLLESAQPPEEDMNGISDIIAEETPAYFSGAKSAQEVCDIMQNRVQLYLDEIE